MARPFDATGGHGQRGGATSASNADTRGRGRGGRGQRFHSTRARGGSRGRGRGRGAGAVSTGFSASETSNAQSITSPFAQLHKPKTTSSFQGTAGSAGFKNRNAPSFGSTHGEQGGFTNKIANGVGQGVPVEDASILARYQERYDQLKLARAKEREMAIKNGQMADPNQPTSLKKAITPVGTCTSMCPEFERVERIVQKMVDKSEKNMETKMLKRFRRSAAGYDEQLPSDIRTPNALLQTTNYLIRHVVGGSEPLALIHKFVWDRTRSVRNDFSVQQVTQEVDVRLAVTCLERIARFHIVSLHLLSSPANEEQFDPHQEREQLNNTMLSLMYYYDDNRGRISFPNEVEFRAYYIIFSIQDQRPDLESRVQKWPASLLTAPQVQIALELYAASCNTWNPQRTIDTRRPNAIAQGFYARFFNIVNSPSVSYLMACVAEIYFNYVRQTAIRAIWKAYCRAPLSQQHKNEEWTVEELTRELHFDDEKQTIEFCQSQDLQLAENANGQLYLNWGNRPVDSIDWNPSSEHAFSEAYVESKRVGRSLVAIILGMTVREAARMGMIDKSALPVRMENFTPDAATDYDGSLFVSDKDNQTPAPVVETKRTLLDDEFPTSASAATNGCDIFGQQPPSIITTDMANPTPPATTSKPSSFGQPSQGFGQPSQTPNTLSMFGDTTMNNVLGSTAPASSPFAALDSQKSTAGAPSLSPFSQIKPVEVTQEIAPSQGPFAPPNTAAFKPAAAWPSFPSSKSVEDENKVAASSPFAPSAAGPFKAAATWSSFSSPKPAEPSGDQITSASSTTTSSNPFAAAVASWTAPAPLDVGPAPAPAPKDDAPAITAAPQPLASSTTKSLFPSPQAKDIKAADASVSNSNSLSLSEKITAPPSSSSPFDFSAVGQKQQSITPANDAPVSSPFSFLTPQSNVGAGSVSAPAPLDTRLSKPNTDISPSSTWSYPPQKTPQTSASEVKKASAVSNEAIKPVSTEPSSHPFTPAATDSPSDFDPSVSNPSQPSICGQPSAPINFPVAASTEKHVEGQKTLFQQTKSSSIFTPSAPAQPRQAAPGEKTVESQKGLFQQSTAGSLSTLSAQARHHESTLAKDDAEDKLSVSQLGPPAPGTDSLDQSVSGTVSPPSRDSARSSYNRPDQESEEEKQAAWIRMLNNAQKERERKEKSLKRTRDDPSETGSTQEPGPKAPKVSDSEAPSSPERRSAKAFYDSLPLPPILERIRAGLAPKSPTDEELAELEAAKEAERLKRKNVVDQDQLLLNATRIAVNQLDSGPSLVESLLQSDLWKNAQAPQRSSYGPSNFSRSASFGRRSASYGRSASPPMWPRHGYNVAYGPDLPAGMPLSRSEMRIRMTGAHGLANVPLKFSPEQKAKMRREGYIFPEDKEQIQTQAQSPTPAQTQDQTREKGKSKGKRKSVGHEANFKRKFACSE